MKISRENDRVRDNTPASANWTIDKTIEQSVHQFAGKGTQAISARIQELEREWDVERILELNASSVAATGLALGIAVNKKWLIVPGVVVLFLFQHAVQGWCPPLPILRRYGVRTRGEIDREKYALKALRGDFEEAHGPGAALASASS